MESRTTIDASPAGGAPAGHAGAPRLLVICGARHRDVVVAAAEAAWPALAGDGPACTVVETLEEARRHLTDRGVDAIVLDLHLPSTEGLDGVALLRVAAPEVPLLVLAGDDADPLVVPALAEGAQEALRVAALDGRVLWLGVQLATQRKAAALRSQREREAGGTVLDAIDSAAVALDGTGRITGCNEAWQRAAVAGGVEPADLFGQAAEVFALIDASAQLVHVSDHTRAMLDLLPREMESWTPLDGIHPADRPAASEAFEWAIAHPGERRSVRARARAHPAGSWRTFDLVLTNLLDHPAVRAVTVVGNDVTAQTRSRIVAGLESRLLAQLPVAITVTDDAGIVVYWNRRSEELYGWTSEEVLGRSVEELGYVPPEESHSIYGEMLDTGHWEGELEVRTKHGTPVAILVTLQALVDDIIGFRGAVAASVDDTERRRLREVLAHQALHDTLTGLPNRALFLDRLDQSLARQRRSHRTVAVLFVDLDRFKLVNDSYGHQAGDEVLRTVAARFDRVLRPEDTVARLGGDEFAVCCDAVEGPAEAVALADRLTSALSQPIRVAGHDFYVTPSIGIVLARDVVGQTAESLLRDADVAMYHAKSSGRARWELFDQHMREDSLRRSELVADLRHAVTRRELRLHYQPVVSLETGAIVGFEGLLRWQHPTKGLLPPGEFIELAEETNLIVPIGAWVITEAAAQLSRWQARYAERELSLAVNLSGRQIASPGLGTVVRAAVAAHRLDPTGLCFEITESVLMHDAEASSAVLAELRDVGVRLAIDDFGTGYSSLAYLKRFPVDSLKVDRSFVDGLGHDPEDSVIVHAVIELAASLGLDCVAEGVEREDQLGLLSELECGFAQGYLWSPPVPVGEVEAFLEAWDPSRVLRTAGMRIPTPHPSMRAPTSPREPDGQPKR